MGIHDRDYSRPDQPGSAGAGLSSVGFRPQGWSVNAWLIAICVAVFMVDQFLPRMLAYVSMVPVVQLNNGVVVALPTATKTDMSIPERGTLLRTLSSVSTKDPFWISGNGQTFQPAVGNVQQNLARGGVAFLDLGSGGEFTITTPEGGKERGTYHLFAKVIAAPPIWTFGYFSTAKALMHWVPGYGLQGFEFWRFLSFQFLHANLTHLLFNMIGLYFFGSIVEKYLGSKRYLAFYLLCGMAGAAMYLALNFLGWSIQEMTGKDLPVLLVNDPGTPLVGASAGVFGVILACAFLVPNAMVLLFFVIPMRLATLAYGLVAVALFTVIFNRNNAGGEAAHLGGAIAGWWFIRHPHSLHGFFDFLGRYDPTSRSGAAYRAGRVRSKGGSTLDDAEIDRILAKIHDQGLQSLTAKEKRALREASKR
jgi:membrane associated rhomboid family serine protease